MDGSGLNAHDAKVCGGASPAREGRRMDDSRFEDVILQEQEVAAVEASCGRYWGQVRVERLETIVAGWK